MISKRFVFLLGLACVHFAGIYLFTGGFLLTRLSLTESAVCSSNPCSLRPTHKRAVFLIIDSLRFDFLSLNSPTPTSPYHHNVLTLPQELTASYPQNSFLFNSYADPPTTTLQRIKGITTGSLPTFVDIGNNFGGSSIAEDSVLKQLRMAGKKVAFMGDDTWMSVFPDSFESNMTFPYDSFNVEDLHTVDEGVIEHIFPLLEDESQPFDFLIGHFLGVDHVGHRVGPDHPSMKAKLQQMNNVLTRVVKLIDNDTLLIVLGDHGMDRSGDHGGDGTLETSSALWIYSKGPALMRTDIPVPPGLLQYTTFPGATVPHRSVQQIDILPSLSLLLGLPIPFNNLGTVIPELFWGDQNGDNLRVALELNAAQVNTYVNTYRDSPSGAELDDAWQTLQSEWTAVQTAPSVGEARLVTLINYNRAALSACRAMWAQFNPLLMGLGLVLLSIGLLASWCTYRGLSQARNDWDAWLGAQLLRCLRAAAGGTVIGFMVYLLTPHLHRITALDCILFAAPFTSCVVLVIFSPPISTLQKPTMALVTSILHTFTFFSNSLTFWEDRIVPFFIVTSILPSVLTGFTAPTARFRYRILGFALLFAVCVRLMSISTVCREEQHPYCHVTFYASSTLPSPPSLVLLLIGPATVGIPWVMRRFQRITRSDLGVARLFLPWILQPSLVAGSAYWIMEWADSAGVLGNEFAPFLRISRTWVSRLAFGLAFFAGGTLWWIAPLCVDIEVDQPIAGGKRQVKILGYANIFGSPYLIFWTIFLSIVFITTQLTGQLVLSLAMVALLAYLEMVDSVRDVKQIEAAFASATPSSILDLSAASDQFPIQFSDIVPIALLGIHAFFGTGHQSTISSIQWKSAFLLTPTVTYPFALTVILNFFGPIFLMGLAAPLLALWNRAPLRIPPVSPDGGYEVTPDADAQVKGESTLAALGFMIYYNALLLGTAVSAAILRRHLMVWKVFAPRFMFGAASVLVVDSAVLVGVGLGVERITHKVGLMFRAPHKRNL